MPFRYNPMMLSPFSMVPQMQAPQGGPDTSWLNLPPEMSVENRMPPPANPPALLDAPPQPQGMVGDTNLMGNQPPPLSLHSPEGANSVGADLYTQLPMMMAPQLRGPAALGNIASRVARTMNLTGPGLPGVEEAQAPPPDPLADARKAVADLRSDLSRFEPSVGNRRQGETEQQYRARIIELQRELGRATDDENRPLYRRTAPDRQGRFQPGELDGNWAGRTTEATAIRRRQIQEQLTKAEETVRSLEGDRRQANWETAYRRLGQHERFAIENSSWLGPLAGFLGGSVLAWPMRASVAGATNYVHRNRVAAANDLLPPMRADGRAQYVTEANAPGRFANVNRFYERGGGREPFSLSPTGRGGWVENRTPGERFGSVANLYPEGHWSRQYVRGQDALPMSVLAGSNYYSAGRVETAERDVREAEAAADRNGSLENTERLAQARARLAFARIYERATQTAPLSYGPAIVGRQYDMSRPLVERGQAEVGRLQRWRRSQ